MTMKNLILILLLVIPLCVCASKKRDDTPYLKGAVPMENGIVVFRKNFRIPAQSDKQIRDNMLYYVKDVLVANGMEGPVTRMLIGLNNEDTICARVEEWMVFEKKFLYVDKTRFRYQVNVTIDNHNVNMWITQISYYYRENWDEMKPTGEGGEIYRAEEWIDDAHCLNKKGKLAWGSARFRRKTVDRVKAIFENAMDMFEQKVQEQKDKEEAKKQEPVKKRKFVEE